MPDNQRGEVWRVRERSAPVSTVLNFTPDGLVLGAGTVLIRTEGPRRLHGLAGREAQVLALLSAAYGRAIPSSVLGNIARAAKAWSQGDDCLAYVHLAHARLGELQYARDAAQRLMMVDSFLKAGGSPRTIFEALKVSRSYVDALEKDYNPAEPRVPPGSGKPSGEWTKGDASGGEPASAEQTGNTESSTHSPLSYVAPPGSPSWLAELEPAAAASLGEFAATVVVSAAGAALVLGLIFIPSPNNIHVEGEVAGIPGLRYSWNRDEAVLRFTYESPDGQIHVFTAQRDTEGLFRDEQGRVVGRVLPGGTIAVDPAAVSPDLVQDDEPKLCPAPGKDRRTNARGLDYENYIKSIVNPQSPTPPYMGYKLSNTRGAVTFDDCEQSSGTMVEIKYGYAKFLQTEWGRELVAAMFVKQATNQVAAAGTRPVRWYFSDKQTADYAKQVFTTADQGLGEIQIKFEPWPGSTK